MKKSICIVCKKEKKGVKVEDDLYLEAIRKIKTRLNIARNNILVVCKDCLPKAQEKRRRFERTIMTWGVLATLLFVLLVLMSPTLQSIFLALIAGVFLILFSLISYFPRVEEHGRKKGGNTG
jgi:L-asparagine transporter-like permease